MLIDETLFGQIDKVKNSITLLLDYYKLTDNLGYYLAFSGGKDSVVIKKLAQMSGVKFDAHYNLTTIDPPELVKFIKKEHPDVKIDLPEQPFLVRLIHEFPPLRHIRWCCKEYKERGGSGRYVITGVRRAESYKRTNRRAVESCHMHSGKILVNPIINWDDQDVWKFIRFNNLPYCKLYDEGWKRIGCLFCPFSDKNHRLYETKRYPIIKNNFIKAFEKLYQYRIKNGKEESVSLWKSGEEMFWWWIKDENIQKDPDQCVLFD